MMLYGFFGLRLMPPTKSSELFVGVRVGGRALCTWGVDSRQYAGLHARGVGVGGWEGGRGAGGGMYQFSRRGRGRVYELSREGGGTQIRDLPQGEGCMYESPRRDGRRG